jgi:DNA modification methylase
VSPHASLYCGDALDVLRTLPAESVQCVVTSPPYWRQRDYEIPGQLGLEETPEEYTARLVELLRDVRRALSGDGSLWLNLGDKWASGGRGGGGSFMLERGDAWAHAKDAKGWRNPPAGYKDKDLVGVPWMVAFALRADGWFLRQCNIWAKPNGMPESVQDRSTISHEYVFQLTKSNDYYYDIDAARTPAAPASETRLAQDVEAQIGSERGNGGAKTNGRMKAVARKAHGSTLTGAPHGRHALGDNLPEKERRTDKQRGHSRKHEGFNDRWDAMERSEQQANGANLRSVWWIAPAQYREAHFAVMPEKLATICIAAGSRPGDVVLDPFGGSGTVAAVATGMGRRSIYIDLNPAYLELARQRIGPMLCEVVEWSGTPTERTPHP